MTIPLDRVIEIIDKDIKDCEIMLSYCVSRLEEASVRGKIWYLEGLKSRIQQLEDET